MLVTDNEVGISVHRGDSKKEQGHDLLLQEVVA
jgi:hypothetical protein